MSQSDRDATLAAIAKAVELLAKDGPHEQEIKALFAQARRTEARTVLKGARQKSS